MLTSAFRLVWKALRHPVRTGKVILHKTVGILISLFQWESRGAFARRHFPLYQIYRKVQQTKLFFVQHHLTQAYEPMFEKVLGRRLSNLPEVKAGCSALCLAARLGAEVRAFHRNGCFAVGIDLNPGKANPYVLPGDFHSLQFPDESVDIVYSNSLDHVFDLSKFVSEVRRVLKPSGVAIFEVVYGVKEGYTPGLYETFVWETVRDLEKELQREGLLCEERGTFHEPWKGVTLLCRKQEAKAEVAVDKLSGRR